MLEKLLIPSVDMRLGSLLEYNRRREMEFNSRGKKQSRITITISREFGCEAYLMAEHLRGLMEKRTGESWVVMDKELLEKVARDHDLSEKVLRELGEKSRLLDEVLATLSTRWKSERDHYRLLCRQIISLAEQGNVIFVGRGSSVVTQSLKNCRHFRLFASMEFKIRSISRRLEIPHEEAEKLIATKQKVRDKFIKDFLDRDAYDLSFYHLVFNNDKNDFATIARTIADYVSA